MLDEHILAQGDKRFHNWLEPTSEDLGKKLSKAVNQASWSVVIELGGAFKLWDENNIG